MDDEYQPGEAEAERISYLIDHAIEGHRGYTEALWRALAADTSDCYDEGRWLRQIADMVVGQILDRERLPIEERGTIALDAIGLRDTADPRWRLKQDIADLSMFDDLTEGLVSRKPAQIVKLMKKRGHFRGKSDRNAAKVVSRILCSTKK